MFRTLVQLLVTGLYAVDFWDADEDFNEPTFFVRPAIRGFEGRRTLHPSWGGPCVMRGPSGCALSHDARPYGCRSLEPRPLEERRKTGCVQRGGTHAQHVMAWHPFQSVIRYALVAIVEAGGGLRS
jgi:hypothetical protein